MKKTIWVIDDDPIYNIIIKKIILKSAIFSSTCSFNNGQEALNKIIISSYDNNTLPDVILLDINMPVMDGWEFLETLEDSRPKINKKIVIYIISSSIAIEDKNKSKLYADVLGYLSKPISIEDLISISKNF